MPTKNEIKQIHALRMKKVRTAEGLFVAEGTKVVNELLQSNWEVVNLFATEQWEGRVNHERVSGKELERMSQLSTPNQVLAVVKQKQHEVPQKARTVLVLDGINDPGNLGTIVRTADWFGIEAIVCSNDSADIYNSKTVQSSMGSLFRVPVTYCNLGDFLQSFTGSIYGACMDGQPIDKLTFTKPCAVVLGSESHGIREDTMPQIKRKVTIPGSGRAESLNVGVAAGIFCSKLL